MSIFIVSKSTQRPPQAGFALVIALSLMAFVLLLLLTISTLVQVESQSAQSGMKRMEAEQTALLSLSIAIGKLQEVAGPDQRVTAAAEVLNDSENLYTGGTTPAMGQDSWTGVWKSDTVTNGTPSYSPATPNARQFVGWLVSSANDTTGEFELPTSLSAITTLAVDSVKLASDSTGNAHGSVEKVKLETGSMDDTYFAFIVEDESVKADLSWSEIPSSESTAERYQTSRLAGAPGPDFGVLNGAADNGPFGAVTYPLTIDSNTLISDSISKIRDTSDITAIMTVPQDASDWLKNQRSDVTWGSRGVLTDVKYGGLRRDLSLAFEMDGDADVSAFEQPTKFNQQVGEFVGNGDRLSSPSGLKPSGLPVEERFLFRDTLGSGTPFSDDIVGSAHVLRGPNWWALRDYANLYKRLSGVGGEYTMQARTYYPNRSSESKPYSDLFDIIGASDTWDRQTNVQQQGSGSGTEHYLYRPAAANYAPVNLGTSILISVLAQNVTGTVPNQTATLAVALDPLFYFWNPYNRKIELEHIAVRLDRGFPGQVKLWINGVEHSTMGLSNLLTNNVTNRSGAKIVFLIKDPSGGPIILEPGEVVIASPSAAGTAEAIFGYATDNSSGIIMTKLNGGSTISVNTSDSIGVNFIQGGGTNSATRHDMDTSIPDASETAATIVANFDTSGEETQSIHIPMWAGAREMAEYISPAALDTGTPVTTTTVSALTSGKAYFGAHAVLIKPASSGAGNADPVEMFSRFNPAPMLMKRDFYADCMLNQIYRHVAANGANAVLDEAGINFSGSTRGTNWGLSYQDTGSTTVPTSNIPSTPLISLAEFANANLSVMGTDPYKAVGNSWSSPLLTPTSAYGLIAGMPWSISAQDYSWLINDALFDRYYLSGLAPDFTIGSAGYSASNTLDDTISLFTSNDYSDAKANPVLRPYLPSNENVSDIVALLSADDGYKKLGAYSLIQGAFNVNSTSISAWEAFLRANRNLDVEYAQSDGSDGATGSPFPSSSSPSAPGNGAQAEWSGFSRLTDTQIAGLATRIVDQVKLRGPFMSLSDFINHRMGTLNEDVSYTGALQAALDLEAASGGSGINADSRAAAENYAAVDPDALSGVPDYSNKYYETTLKDNLDGQKTTTGIPGDITQADLLLSLAPRMTARSDTFRVRAYGEVSSASGGATTAVCEAVLQRLPQYVDSDDDAWKDPWNQVTDPTVASISTLSAINQQFGRRFKVVQFRWLNADEI